MRVVSDLHIHSTFSDGFWTVEQIFDEAKKRGIEQISITDHNSVGSVKLAEKFSKEKCIDFIPGVEIDVKTKINGKVFHNHLLGYGFDEKMIESFLSKSIEKSNGLFNEMILKLKEICKLSNENKWQTKSPLTTLKKDININEINIKSVLRDEYEKKYSRKINDLEIKKITKTKLLPPEILSRFIKNNLFEDPKKITNYDPKTWKFIVYKEFAEIFDLQYEERYFITHEETINKIKKAGGIAILAHPLLDYPEASFENKEYTSFIEFLIKNGLDGLENYFYSNDRFSKEQENLLNKQVKEFNEKHNLLTTFGSDCHGPKGNDKSKIFLGKFGSDKKLVFARS